MKKLRLGLHPRVYSHNCGEIHNLKNKSFLQHNQLY